MYVVTERVLRITDILCLFVSFSYRFNIHVPSRSVYNSTVVRCKVIMSKHCFCGIAHITEFFFLRNKLKYSKVLPSKLDRVN